ncbi:hypothetical protein F4778DRAFT_751870 [Xylariomycetidae sp. FL2044]|nr:hypothetical protein F4778DRAFT_751870 [Xylariomycetidae sp. FL2044]
MRSHLIFAFLAVIGGLSEVSGRNFPRMRLVKSPRGSGMHGTGPQGFLTRNDAVKAPGSPMAMNMKSNSGIGSAESSSFDTCYEPTTATVEDCQAVIGDIRSNNGTIAVAEGFCLNWYEGSCLARVCSIDGVYSASSSSIADSMTESILDECIIDGYSGVTGDCEDWQSDCGTYRYQLYSSEGF